MPDRALIKANLKNTLTETDLRGFKKIYRGKVRDTYEKDGESIFITTDRQSAFDRILASVPFKGAVLNQISAFWFDKTKDIVKNHLIATPDPNVSIVKKVKILPIEVVVRGYITGTTDTSAWVNYQKGERFFCGVHLPEGLKKNQKFDKPILTPTTKKASHDEKISREGIISQGLVAEDKWNKVEEYAIKVFELGQKLAAKKGFILVDTKYEFGEDEKGNIILADEVHTPDSSRYWIADTYKKKIAAGEEPDSFDKEFLRLWFVNHCDPYHDKVLPDAPDDLVEELSFRYIDIYEKLTGKKFEYNAGEPIHDRIQKNLDKYFS
jgi:phosphoribosylaminoimidazole-succinocarboxamide synthase